MKKLFLKISAGYLLLFGVLTSTAQPVHTPIAAYKYMNSNNGYSRSILTGATSHSSSVVFDIAVSQNYHFQCGTSTFTGTGNRMFICKKDAVTGAPIGMNNANAGILYGGPESSDECKGMLLDEANNRVYLFGTMQNPGDIKRAVVICYNMTTLAIETGFAYGFGVSSVNSTNFESEVIDMTLTNAGNFIILMNVKDINNKYYLSLAELNLAGDFIGSGQISNPSYECYGSRVKYVYDVLGVIYVVGKATNTSGQAIPMFWAIYQSSYTLKGQLPAQFTSPLAGYGAFVDFNMAGVSNCIAIGNNTSNSGIWAKILWNSITGTYNYDATFKNTGSLPGIQAGVIFKRSLLQPDGYTVTLSGPASTNGSLGYITPTGNAYANTQSLQLQHANGLNKDNNGNIIVGGCYSAFISTAKFTSYSGSWIQFVNRIPTNASSITKEEEFTAFPNPAGEHVVLNYTGTVNGSESISITDISGKKVLGLNNISFDNQKITVDISELKNGVYFIQLNTAEKTIMQKIVKQ